MQSATIAKPAVVETYHRAATAIRPIGFQLKLVAIFLVKTLTFLLHSFYEMGQEVGTLWLDTFKLPIVLKTDGKVDRFFLSAAAAANYAEEHCEGLEWSVTKK
jgi:hypothetical protein